jgi:probable lipoprotein NlpC
MRKVPIVLLLLWVLALLLFTEGCRGKRSQRRKSAAQLLQRAGNLGQKTTVPSKPLSERELGKIIETARSYTGTPYLSGGTTRSGMDCSGLVSASFSAVNKTLPRISYQQAEAGTPISESQIAPGDLVFFTDKRGGSRITHVGIITEVRNKETVRFIHASNSLGVVENNLKQNYWKSLFVKAVRIR